MKNKLWGGRFTKKTHPLMEEFTRSMQFDKKLAIFDCQGSIAHAEMLKKCSIIPKLDADKIIKGLKSILSDIDKKLFKYDSSAEDIHTAIQNSLYKKIGEPSLKLHTARSRNDQVALDTRLYCKHEIKAVKQYLGNLERSMKAFAGKNIDVIVPGFTHLQNAQPVLLAHQLLAYCEMFKRDVSRLDDCMKRVDVMPLGSCALSGTSLKIDRAFVAKRLGFSKISENSMDAVSDRDFVIEFIFVLSLISMHLSRLAEDFIIFSSSGFGILEMPDEFSTGSSMMPQKKNPDALELIRGKCGTVYGSLVDALTVMKGLPLTYNRDMQQDKEALFKAAETVESSLDILQELFKGLKVDKEKAKACLKSEDLYATDVMEYLVKKGVPLKNAHDTVGMIMLYCKTNKINIAEISLRTLRSFNPGFDKDVYGLLDAEKSISAKISYGGTSPAQVRKKV